MNLRTVLLAFLASPLFFPASCTTATLPAAHALSWLDTRDLAAGAPAHLALLVPVADRRTGADIRGVEIENLPVLLAADPRLTPRLPTNGEIDAEGDRLRWRVRAADANGQVIELQRISESFTQNVRYRATDAGIAPLSSRVFSVGHAFSGMLIAVVSMALLQSLLRWRFLPPPLPRPMATVAARAVLAETSGQFHTQCVAALLWLGMAAMQGIVMSVYTRGEAGLGWPLLLSGAGLWHGAIAWQLWRGRRVPVVHRYAPEFAVLMLALLIVFVLTFNA